MTKLLQNEIEVTISSNIKLIEDFQCYDSEILTSFDCVFISSGVYITEYNFQYSTSTNKITQQSETIYQNYKDFTTENIKGKFKYFAVKGYSKSMKTSALLIYKRKNQGGSEFLNYGIQFREFGARTFDDIYFDFYRYFDEYKLYAKANPSRKVSVFKVGNFSVNVEKNAIEPLRRASINFPDSANKPVINIGDYFTLPIDGGNNNAGTTVSNTSSGALSSGIMIVIIVIIVVLVIVGLGIFYYIKKGKFAFIGNNGGTGKKDGAGMQ